MKNAFEPHKISKDSFTPINEHIIVEGMEFKERVSRGGIIIPGDDAKSEGIRPRWCKVYKTGPNYTGDLTEGQYILVTHGRWTRGIDVEDETGKKTLRRVDSNDILLVSDEPITDDYISDKGL